MKTLKLALFAILIILFSKHEQLLSQFCTPAQPSSPVTYISVDPPVFIIIPASGSTCNQVQFGAAVPPFCPIQYQFPPVPFATVGIGESCILISNYTWNNNFTVNTSYCWGVHTVGATINWQNMPGSEIRRLPAALPLVSLIYPVYGAVNISLTPLLDWSKIDSANNYTVRIYTEACCINTVFDSTVNRDSLRIPAGKLNWSTAYWWKVKPYKSGGEGPFSDPNVFTTAPPQIPQVPVLLSPPNNIIAMPLTDTLRWNSSSGADSYRLQAATDAAFNNLVVNDSNLTATSRIVTGLSQLTIYYWRVNAKNSAGTSAWSTVWNFKTIGTAGQVILYTPLNNAVNIPTTYIFRWSKAIDQTTRLLVSNYWFEMVSDTVTMANLLRDSTLTDTLRTVTGMLNNQNYWWRVKAKNQIGWGSFTARFKFTTIVAPPALAPTLIRPLNNAVSIPLTPLLDWTVVTGSTSYRVQVSTDSTFATTQFDSTTNRDSIIVPAGKLINNTKYYWHVRGQNTGGNGPYSVKFNFRTNPIGVNQLGNEIPKVFNLYYNYPNPFNPVTKIKFDIPNQGFVVLKIYDVLGSETTTLVNEYLQPGSFEVNWDGNNYASGIYYYKITSGNFSDVKKMVLLK